jgi:siroheme synthase
VAIYMPGGSYREISRQMMAAGIAPETACLIVSNACRKNQELLWTDLSSLPSITPPEALALLIVGAVARCRDEWAAATVLQSYSETIQASINGL